MFCLARTLFSPGSAEDRSSLFVCFIDTMALARKIAAISLLVWKKGVRFDAEQLKQQAA
jgi:hypothetical protein